MRLSWSDIFYGFALTVLFLSLPFLIAFNIGFFLAAVDTTEIKSWWIVALMAFSELALISGLISYCWIYQRG